MASIKKAISLQESILDQADEIAQKLDISRSQLFAIALKEFIERHKNKELLEAINATYNDSGESEDQLMLQSMRSRHKKLVKGQW